MPDDLPKTPEMNIRERLGSKYKQRMWLFASLAAFLVLLVISVSLYQWSLSPKDRNSTEKVRVIIEPGDSVANIANKLEESDLIRSSTTFRIYAELTDTKSRLQAGGYALSKNLSVADIIDHMTSGQADELNVIILPGMTLKEQYDPDLDGSLASQGFSEEEINQALTARYQSSVLATRPSGATLEGYMYADTYRVMANGDLSLLIEKSLAEFERVVEERSIDQKLSDIGLTLHEGVTLASIIQKEASSAEDQPQIAQVFLKRLREGIPLQSDPTFIYAARQAGQTPTVKFNSPYNTYLHKGLPPGPIATFNLSALMAVIEPANGEYLYFVADDKGETHFATTLAEHEATLRDIAPNTVTIFSITK